jgi:uncharacterized membrane protein
MAEQQTSSARSDLLGGAFWVGLGTLILIESVRMERFEKMGATVYTYPGFVPGLIGGFIVLLGLALAWRGFSKRSQENAQAIPAMLNRRLVIALACSLGYSLLLLTRMPFMFATAIFVAVFTFANMPTTDALARRAFRASLSGIVTSAIVFYTFQEIFLVRLP